MRHILAIIAFCTIMMTTGCEGAQASERTFELEKIEQNTQILERIEKNVEQLKNEFEHHVMDHGDGGN